MSGENNKITRDIDASDTQYFASDTINQKGESLLKQKNRRWSLVNLIFFVFIGIICVFLTFATFWREEEGVVYGGIFTMLGHSSDPSIFPYVLLFFILPLGFATFIAIKNFRWIINGSYLPRYLCTIPLAIISVYFTILVLMLFDILPTHVEVAGYGDCCYYIDSQFSPIAIYSFILLLISMIMTIVLAILNIKQKNKKQNEF